MSTSFAGYQLVASSHSEPTTSDSADSHKAWHLFALLLSLGRPTRALELASKCELFAVSPELVHHLCNIPNSPIRLTSDLFVTLSFTSLMAIAKYLTSSNLVSFICSPQVDRSRIKKRTRTELELEVLPSAKRRVNFEFGNGEGDVSSLCSPKRVPDACGKVHLHIDKDKVWTLNIQQSEIPEMTGKLILTPSLHIEDTARQSGWLLEKTNGREAQDSTLMSSVDNMYKNLFASDEPHTCKIKELSATSKFQESESVIPFGPDLMQPFSYRALLNSFVCKAAHADNADPTENEDPGQKSCELVKQGNNLLNDTTSAYDALDGMIKPIENERIREDGAKEVLGGSIRSMGEFNGACVFSGTTLLDRSSEGESNKKIKKNCHDMESFTKSKGSFPLVGLSGSRKLSSKPSAKMKANDKGAVSPSLQALFQSSEHRKAVQGYKEKEQLRIGQKSIIPEKKHNDGQSGMHHHQKKGISTSASSKDQWETKTLPEFESFIVEEEEGSGGYGTVYRARRKKDGDTVAIKCPHANAHKHHVNNELKMLERFGGKNFIIKYEGCFKSGNSDCFVLEHVEHDRPEVLKKEIDIFQLQWYGYCLFRALASLHKQGVVHRDVKPGNFLYSTKANKGYLIDFNLAMDLHQKYGSKNKLKLGDAYAANSGPSTLQIAKSLSPTKIGKFARTNSFNAMKKAEMRGSKLDSDPKTFRRKGVDQTKSYHDLVSWDTKRSQGADGSGITSTREAPSAERLREPLPRQGRKELINLLQHTMHMNREASSVPATMRKRIAAPPSKTDGNIMVFTPMPLHSRGHVVLGAGVRKNKGDRVKEGPCVGTKGFRAPEVLVKSAHQGPKIDIWSAGVTLLYLVIGRMPFCGDPEQNLKDIAKLRGSEDLWEVAKLHNRELSFPVDLYDMESLPSTNLRDWCRKNSKRPDFLDVVPESLFDLVDRCLIVNPRVRISAEEALKHEFFASCHEELRKQKQLRLGLGQDIRRGLSIQRKSQPCSVSSQTEQDIIVI